MIIKNQQTDPIRVTCPISTFIGILLVIIYLMFKINIFKHIPIKGKLHQVFCSNFVHIELSHLVTNLYSLYVLSSIEQEMGLKSFMYLMSFLLSFNTLVEFIWINYKGQYGSIGFSGILFGLTTWRIVSNKTIDSTMILAAILLFIRSSKNTSLSGHLIGAISGILGGLIWKYIHKEN